MSEVPLIDYEYTNQDVCNAHCLHGGYTYFALAFGYMCQCGNMLPAEENRLKTSIMCQLVSVIYSNAECC